MTQALNLANFANNLNTSGQTANGGLQNSSVTVSAGTGMSGGGAVALGSSVTLTNAGVTSVTAGTGISVSAGTGGVTITNTAPAGGGVTSLNGQTGAITNTNIDTIGCLMVVINATNGIPNYYQSFAYNTTIAGSSLRYNFSQGYNGMLSNVGNAGQNYGGGGTALSGTWRLMSYASSFYEPNCNNGYWYPALAVRIS